MHVYVCTCTHLLRHWPGQNARYLVSSIPVYLIIYPGSFNEQETHLFLYAACIASFHNLPVSTLQC